ncbi:MAG: beta-propeller fold lactonase family protein [Opitutus sp.]
MSLKSYLLTTLCLLGGLAAPGAVHAGSEAKAVYTQNNSAAGNSVLAYSQNPDGSLTPGGSYSTGGTGTGSGLGSQGALAITENHRWLIAVNAGSHTISAFEIRPSGLVLSDQVWSGGKQPISVTIDQNLVYVLNAGGAVGGTDNISGFYLTQKGALLPLAHSTRPLSGANVAPAQVSFAPSGDHLVVTEKGTNLIDTFAVNESGLAGWGNFTPSSGMTPFGFAFTPTGFAVVSEAFGGAAGASRLSSYEVDSTGLPEVVTASLPTGQNAACWVVVARNGHFAYVTNTASNTVSGLRVAGDGTLTLLGSGGVSAQTGATPIDAAVSANSQFLYVLNSGAHSIGSYRIGAMGELTWVGDAAGLPAAAVGLVAR